MAMYSPAFHDALDDSFELIIQNKYNLWPKEYQEISNVQSTKKPWVKRSSISGLGVMAVKPEGDGVSYEDFNQGYDVTYTPVAYAKGIRLSFELMDDDQHGVFKRRAEALVRSAQHIVDVTTANILNRGFNASYLGADGVELFSLLHPLTGGGTAQNELTTPADLSITSLRQALTDIDGWVDDKGLPIVVPMKKLIVPKELRFVPGELFDSELRPYIMDNEKNTMADQGLSWSINHYLTDPDAWFLFGAKDDININFFWRMKPKQSSDVDFDSDDLKFKIVQRFTVGWDDWRGVFGTPGAG